LCSTSVLLGATGQGHTSTAPAWAAPTRHPQAEVSALDSCFQGGCLRRIDLRTFGHHRLRPLARLFSTRGVNLLRVLRRIRQNDDMVVSDPQNSPTDGEDFLQFATPQLHLSKVERCDQWRVLGQNTHFAFGTASDDHIGFLVT
jgi:hypothetical protein